MYELYIFEFVVPVKIIHTFILNKRKKMRQFLYAIFKNICNLCKLNNRRIFAALEKQYVKSFFYYQEWLVMHCYFFFFFNLHTLLMPSHHLSKAKCTWKHLFAWQFYSTPGTASSHLSTVSDFLCTTIKSLWKPFQFGILKSFFFSQCYSCIL